MDVAFCEGTYLTERAMNMEPRVLRELARGPMIRMSCRLAAEASCSRKQQR